jgi:probable phosphoglycerate mutase
MVESFQSSGIRILLVRHGETEWNRIHRFQGRSDIPLNKKGKEQARALASALKDEHITAIYSSPLTRALETARLIKAYHPLSPLFEEEGLLEMDLGDFEGMEALRWASQYPDFRKDWEKNPASVSMPRGESLQEVQVRVIDTLEQITQNYPNKSTLLVSSHNFVIIAILCYAFKISFDRFRECRQETASLNILYKHKDQYRVELVNERSHLENL